MMNNNDNNDECVRLLFMPIVCWLQHAEPGGPGAPGAPSERACLPLHQGGHEVPVALPVLPL